MLVVLKVMPGKGKTLQPVSLCVFLCPRLPPGKLGPSKPAAALCCICQPAACAAPCSTTSLPATTCCRS
jgi:hypothetical protein